MGRGIQGKNAETFEAFKNGKCNFLIEKFACDFSPKLQVSGEQVC